MKREIIWLMFAGLACAACNITQPQIDDPTKNDTITPPDTITHNDSIVPSDTIIVRPDTIILAVDTIIIGTGDAPGEYFCYSGGSGVAAPGPDAALTIVKFYNPGMTEKVIVQHPIKRYDGINGQFDYDENIGLFLNVLPEGYTSNNNSSLSRDLVKWADSQMDIAGTSPYVPLADDYYLIDWKWHQLMPLSAIAEDSEKNYAEHIHNHVFISDTEWKSLKDLTSGFEGSYNIQPIKGIEIIRVCPKELACYFHDVDRDPYVCWNMSIYFYDGMCLDNAYMYYLYGDCSPYERSYLTYISYCDSLQSVYQQHLTELINNGQIKQLGY